MAVTKRINDDSQERDFKKQERYHPYPNIIISFPFMDTSLTARSNKNLFHYGLFLLHLLFLFSLSQLWSFMKIFFGLRILSLICLSIFSFSIIPPALLGIILSPWALLSFSRAQGYKLEINNE